LVLSVTAALLIGPGAASAEVSDQNLILHGDGEWVHDYQFRPIAKQATPGASGRVVSPDVKGLVGSWRCMVEVGPKTKGAGIVVLGDQAGRGGLECLMGGMGEMRGFMIRTAAGKVLWQDPWAPWMEYEPCVVEVVVERGRVRVQLLHFDGKTLISQSEWLAVDAKLTARPGLMGLMTEKGIGRFWGWQIAEAPLAEVTPDAPNKRRIVPGNQWAIVGPMTWQWKTGAKKRVRQSATVDRAWLFNKQIRGKHQRWSCRVKVEPPSGGAGMIFQADGTSNSGLLCWLGGRYGDGCLMLYDRAKGYRGTIWCGPQGKWKYNTEYVLVGETRPGQARVQMLAADGKTVISESPWKKYDPAVTDREGMIGFHTWKASSEFWAFSTGTQAAAATDKPKAAPQPSGLKAGLTWKEVGGKKRLVHTGKEPHVWENPSLAGIHGLWRTRLIPRGPGRFELCFQLSDRGAKGFAARLKATADGKGRLELIEMPGKVLWYSGPVALKIGTTYLLEGMTITDRVRARLYTGDGKKILADSDQNYVSDAHNRRKGHLGVRAFGDVEFFDGSFTPEK